MESGSSILYCGVLSLLYYDLLAVHDVQTLLQTTQANALQVIDRILNCEL